MPSPVSLPATRANSAASSTQPHPRSGPHAVSSPFHSPCTILYNSTNLYVFVQHTKTRFPSNRHRICRRHPTARIPRLYLLFQSLVASPVPHPLLLWLLSGLGHSIIHRILCLYGAATTEDCPARQTRRIPFTTRCQPHRTPKSGPGQPPPRQPLNFRFPIRHQSPHGPPRPRTTYSLYTGYGSPILVLKPPPTRSTIRM